MIGLVSHVRAVHAAAPERREYAVVIIITDVSYDREGFRFWNGSENITGDLRDLMDEAKASWIEENGTPEEKRIYGIAAA